MLEEGEEVSHDHEDGSRPGLDQLPHLDHELVLGLQLCHGQQSLVGEMLFARRMIHEKALSL